MDPSTELLELLREIRDNQRDLLAVTKVLEAKNEERNAYWKKKDKDRKREEEHDRALCRTVNEMFIQRHESWLRQERRAKTLGVVLILICFITIIVIIMIQRGFFN